MEVRLSVDWSAIREQIGQATSPRFRAEVAERLADAAHDYWIDLARGSLHSSRDLYIAQIGRPRRLSPSVFELGFDGPDARTAELIEFEHPSHQMRPYLAGVVPFRTATTGGQGVMPFRGAWSQSLGTPFKYTGSAAAINFLLAKQVRQHGVGSLEGQRRPGKKDAGPIFGGRRATSAHEFVTFRSTGGQQEGKWIYPAGPGVNLLEQVQEALPMLAAPISQAVFDEEAARHPASWMRKI